MTPYTATATPTSTPGTLRRWKSFWFGEDDPTTASLKELERQGSHVVRVARLVSTLMVFLFSAGSLIALGGNTVQAVYTDWQSGHLNIPAAISLVVIFLLVIAMDTAMVFAGMQIRTMMNRHSPVREMRIHQAVLIGVALVEAGTYAYMSYLYEHPSNAIAWILIGARALSAPFLMIYLTMARTVPITARDIMYQAELTAGRAVLREVSALTSDGSQPLHIVFGVFNAAAEMAEGDRDKLGNVIQVVSNANPSGYVTPYPDGPNGGGQPLLLPFSGDHETELRSVEAVLWNDPHARASDIALQLDLPLLTVKQHVATLMARSLERQSSQFQASAAG